jgi:hypothetical protein
MAERPVAFNRKTAGRIVAAVKRVEHDPRGRVGGRQYGPVADEPLLVKINAADTGGGKYIGVILNPPTNTFSRSTDLSEADLGVEGQACYVWNAQEKGLSTHDLTSGDNANQRYFWGNIRRVASDGALVIVINGLWSYDCEE